MYTLETDGWPKSSSEFPPIVLWIGVVAAVLFFLSGGCGQSLKTQIPTYDAAKTQVLKDGPLIDPAVEQREKLKPGTARAIKKGEPAPQDGILIDSDKAVLYKAIQAERDRRRTELEAERLRQRTQGVIYKAAVKRLEEETKRSWWDRHKGGVLFAVGATVGMAIVLGVLYAVTRGQGAATSSTNAHVVRF